MFKTMTGALCTVAVGLLAGCETPSPQTSPKPAGLIETSATGPILAGPVATASSVWDNTRDGVALAAMAVNQGGMTAVCGVKAIIGADRDDQSQLILTAYRFYVGETFILRGVRHFTTTRSIDAIARTRTSCRMSNVAWQPEFADGPWRLEFTGSDTL